MVAAERTHAGAVMTRASKLLLRLSGTTTRAPPHEDPREVCERGAAGRVGIEASEGVDQQQRLSRPPASVPRAQLIGGRLRRKPASVSPAPRPTVPRRGPSAAVSSAAAPSAAAPSAASSASAARASSAAWNQVVTRTSSRPPRERPSHRAGARVSPTTGAARGGALVRLRPEHGGAALADGRRGRAALNVLLRVDRPCRVDDEDRVAEEVEVQLALVHQRERVLGVAPPVVDGGREGVEQIDLSGGPVASRAP